MCTGITSRGSPTLATSAKITLLKPRLWYFCLCGTPWGAESSRGSGCGEVCYGHIISYIRIYHLVKQWVCLFASRIAGISKMSLSGSSTSAFASSCGRHSTVFFNELLSAFLGLVQDGEGLVFTNTSLPFFCCPK